MMDCVQCHETAKYKCPTCREPYCSVACCKEHRTTPCTPPTPPPDISQPDESLVDFQYPTEDTVLPEKLKLLEESKDLRNCLENPHVREILQLLDKASNPDMLIKEYMQEPIFTEFVDACLNIVQDKQCDA